MTGGWFSPGPTVSSINKTDRHDITEILLKVALNTIKPSKQSTSRLFVDKIFFERFALHFINILWKLKGNGEYHFKVL
jgi:hypothetical protein